jgi:hypothetical protein
VSAPSIPSSPVPGRRPFGTVRLAAPVLPAPVAGPRRLAVRATRRFGPWVVLPLLSLRALRDAGRS